MTLKEAPAFVQLFAGYEWLNKGRSLFFLI